MEIYDIMGPIMIGPSSSHTAGACRLGLVARRVLGDDVQACIIQLHGSFAETGKGHGTDCALLAGLMGWAPDDYRIPNAYKYADESGLSFTFEKIDLGNATHPNTVVFDLIGKTGKRCTVQGSSVGGGQILITNIDGFDVELNGKLNAIIVMHIDKRGIIALVSSTLASAEINIASMRDFRAAKGGLASMIVEVDNYVPEAIISLINALPAIKSTRFIEKV